MGCLGKMLQPYSANLDGLSVLTGTGYVRRDGDSFFSTHALIPSSEVSVPFLPGSTYQTLRKYIDITDSPGIISGGAITDAGGGNINVAAGIAILRIADDDVSELRLLNFSSQVIAIPNDSLVRYVALDYNGGTPTIIISTTQTFDDDTQVSMGSAVNSGGTILVFNNPFKVGDAFTNIIQRFDSLAPANRDASVGGLTLGVTGTRNVTVSAGAIWSRLNDHHTTAKDTSASDTMFSQYYNGTSWVLTGGLTQWPNDQYNDIASGLVTMSNNKYANLWFYMGIEGTTFGFQYGQAEYNTLAQAVAESPPSFRSPNAANVTLLLGRFVFQKGDAVPQVIQQAYDTEFTGTAVENHNDLAGLQGGTTSQYYHLTGTQHTSLSQFSSLYPFAEGDLLTGNGSSTLSKLASPGVPGRVLVSGLGQPAWTDLGTFAPTGIFGTANEISASASIGNVTLSLPSSLTFTGKTVTGGTFNATDFNGPIGGGTRNTGAFTRLGINQASAASVPLFVTGNSGNPTAVLLTDSDGRGMRVATSDYVPGVNTGTVVQLGTGAGTGNTTGIVEARTAGTSASGVLTLNPNGGNVTISGGAATVTSTGINSTPIGATTPSTGAFTTLSSTSDIVSTGSTIYSGGSVYLSGSGSSRAIYDTETGSPDMYFDHRGASNTGSWYWRNGTGGANTRMVVTSTGINSTAIGATTPSTGAFTTVNASGGVTVGTTALLSSSVSLSSSPGVNTGTLTDCPGSGNPTKWIRINDNGVPIYIPAWAPP